jgi:hypothetical protein
MRDGERIAQILVKLWENVDTDIVELRFCWQQVDALIGVESDVSSMANELPLIAINYALEDIYEDPFIHFNPQLILEDAEDAEYYVLREVKPTAKLVTVNDIEEAIKELGN